jgi:flagellar hook-length control protein FliK
LTTMNQFLELDTKPTANGAMAHPRSGKSRHPGKTPEFFPDVLASLSPSKKSEVGDAPASGKIEAASTPDSKADDSGAEGLPPEEKIQQTSVSLEVKQYLQNLVAIEPRREIAADALTLPETEAAPPPPPIASASISGAHPRAIDTAANAKAGENESAPSFEKSPASMSDFEKLEFHEAKIMSPRDSTCSANMPVGVPPNQGLRMEQPPQAVEDRRARPIDDQIRGEPVYRTEQPSQRAENSRIKSVDPQVRVIKVETSFAPSAAPAFVMQFANAITESLDVPPPAPIAAVGNVMPDPRTEVVKNIQIQLHPDELGQINVGMHLRGDELKLNIEVTSRDAEVLLSNDHQALKDLMARAGYDVGEASISISLSPAEPGLSQRHVPANESSQESLAGQGNRQQPGTSEENQKQYQKIRASHAMASETEDGKEIKISASGTRRGNAVFL